MYIPEPVVEPPFSLPAGATGLTKWSTVYSTLLYKGEEVVTATNIFDGGFITFASSTNISIAKEGDNYNNATLKAYKGQSYSFISDELNMFYKNGATIALNESTGNLEVSTKTSATKTNVDKIVLDVDKRAKSLTYVWLVNGVEIHSGDVITLEGTDVSITAQISGSAEIPKVGKALLSTNNSELRFVYDDIEYPSGQYYTIKNGRNEWSGTGIKKIVIDESFKNFDKVEDRSQFYSTSH